ncbi:MAG: MtrB/PioB family decaheme-associated outer membrane protein [Rhodocyclaceae bacterium]|nr:MtrB/PioB family decaheme-associated outer membrane protein [Rhodocyclaceae bacterium]
MRVRKEEINISLLSVAVLGALAAMFAVPVQAADTSEQEIALIRRPTNFVEFGAENVSRSAAKFGEYNGLNKSGADVIGNFSLRGGDAYLGGDSARRWSVYGNDLGTTSRELGANIGDQGRWNLGVGYDELRHNLADTYQTPYVGSNGGNVFTLPSTFGVVDQTSGAPGTRSLSAAQLGAFQTVEIGSTRKNTSVSGGVALASRWDVKVDFNRMEQSGAKLMAFGGNGEKPVVLPNPTNYRTDTTNVALNWTGEKSHMTASYFGSSFRDGYDRVTWSSFTNAAWTDAMTTPPGNDVHQWSLMGGYALRDQTKLLGGLSYSRNTQNDPFVTNAYTFGALPASSLNGLVVNTHVDLKLVDKTTKDLTMSGSIKYDKRDNRTTSYIYDFNAIGAYAADNSNSNRATYPNTPLSIKKVQAELAGDYRIDKSQSVRVALTHDDTMRWCNQFAVSALYPAGTDCVVATGVKENKLAASYRRKVSDAVNLSAGYTLSQRTNDYDIYARTAMVGKNGGIVTAISSDGKTVTGLTVPGQNAGDFQGFHPYLDEDRKQHMLKAGLNWQANDQLSVGLMGRYTDDSYDTTYGWKSGKQWSLNVDAAYNISETASVSGYMTQQYRQRNRTDIRAVALSSATTTAINVPNYATDNGILKDDDITIGLAFKNAGLMGGKLELVGDVSYSAGRTDYGTTLNWVGATTATAGVTYTCASSFLYYCGDVPTIKNTLMQAKLTGTYQVNKSAKVALAYLYQQLKSDDYYFNGLQYGFTPSSAMPTNQQQAGYTLNVVSVRYIYSFK